MDVYLTVHKKRYITRSIIDFANGKHARHVQSLSCARYAIAWRNYIIWLVCVACSEGWWQLFPLPMLEEINQRKKRACVIITLCFIIRLEIRTSHTQQFLMRGRLILCICQYVQSYIYVWCVSFWGKYKTTMLILNLHNMCILYLNI